MKRFGNLLLRGDALFLVVAATGGLIMDVAGSFFGVGPVATLLAGAPGAGIGMIEAHGLALIIGILVWRSPYARHWHVVLAAIHALLGTANLLFWPFFAATGTLTMGYATTSAHWGLVVAHIVALALGGRIAAAASRIAGRDAR